ncbi:MAG: hypothetical protein MJ248_03890 [Bacilli bacterium]|nr:hypothetical protein [Bacilli bacterium]
MKQKKNKTHYVILGLYAMTALCLTASISGTFAWYTYSTRTGLTFEGASVADAGSLQIGVVSDVRIDDYEEYSFVEDTSIKNKYIYWSMTGLNANRINHIIEANGSATNRVAAMTSGKFHGDGSTFTLYDTPSHGTNYVYDDNVNSITKFARSNEYVTLPLAFRLENQDRPGTYMADKHIFFTQCDITSRERISDAVRIFAYTKTKADGNLINPNERYDGYDVVGGGLDLDVNGFYDIWTDPDTDKQYEFPYGEFVGGQYFYEDTPLATDTHDIGKDALDTFTANYKAGTRKIDWTKTEPERAEFKGMSNFMNHRIIMTTTNNTNNYGFLTMLIYLEGWDLSVVNNELGHEFSMDLSFEMD